MQMGWPEALTWVGVYFCLAIFLGWNGRLFTINITKKYYNVSKSEIEGKEEQ